MDTLSRLSAAALALLLVGPSWAVDVQTNVSPFRPTVTYPSGMGGQAVVIPARIQGPVTPAQFGRAWGPALASIGDVEVIDTVPDAKVGGVPATIKSTRKIPWKGIAAGAASFAGSAGAVVAGAVALKDLWDAYHCDLVASTCDVADTTPQTVEKDMWAYSGTPDRLAESPSAAATLYAIDSCKNGACTVSGVTGCSWADEYRFSAVCTVVTLGRPDPVTGVRPRFTSQPLVRLSRKTVTECPAVIDPLNPANSIPSGSPASPDGKCPTGRYSTPNPVQLAERFEKAPESIKEKAPDIAKDIAESGKDLTPEAGPQSLSGPDKVPGTPTSTTTTGPNGEPQTTTKTPVHNVTYNSQTNYYTWNTVTTTTNNYGAPTTVEEKAPDEIPPTDCEVNPEAIGCQKLGAVPEVSEIPKVEIPVAIAPDSGWGAATGSCPSPKTVTFLGQGMEVSWQPVCDFATGIRWIVIALASMSAAWILMGANQKEGD